MNYEKYQDSENIELIKKLTEAENRIKYLESFIDSLKSNEKKSQRREKLFETIAFEAHCFIDVKNWKETINNVLERIGIELNASRVYIFKKHIDDNGNTLFSNRYEWSATGIESHLNKENLQNIIMSSPLMDKWLKQLESGQMIFGKTKHFPKEDMEYVGINDVKSIILAPIFDKENLWGLVGFDDCIKEKEWTKTEIDFIETVAIIWGNSITRKHYEDEIRKSEAKSRAILDTIPDLFFILDKTGVFKEYHAINKKFLYVQPEVFIGKSYKDILPASISIDLEKILQKVIQSNKIQLFEYTLNLNGTSHYYEARITPFNHHSFLVIVREITEQKLAIQSIIESEGKFRTLAEESPNMIFINYKGRIIYVNQQAVNIMGYTREEYYSPDFDFMTLIAPESSDLVLKNYKTHNSGNEIPFYEYIIITKSGKRIDSLISTKLIKINNEIAILGIVTDITQRKQYEAVLMESERKLREALDAKDKFFNILAHDLKSPFSGFLSLFKQLSQDYQNLPANEFSLMMKAINDSASNLYKLLENLLEWSRTQTGKIAYNPEYVDLKFIVNNIIDIFNNSSNSKGIKLINKIQDNEYVYADVPMLLTVFRNLISNSIKFTNSGGSIFIEVHSFSNKMKEISIKDTGIGIEDKNIENLFKIDKQVQTPGTEGETGTGLGLILCKEFVERNGGSISVESKINEGTSFKFTLPVEIN